jgi:hypothetical protein
MLDLLLSPRPATDAVRDIWGDLWTVREGRQTAMGWPVLLGRTPGLRGGDTVIMTAELAAYLEQMRHDPAAAQAALGIGKGALRRLRMRLAHHWRHDREDWWRERLTDLATLTLEEFAERHGVSAGAASGWRARLVEERG